MFQKLALPVLALAGMFSSALALDENMPVPVRVMQINVGFERMSISGRYQSTWENDGVADPDEPTTLPMQGKFGVLEHLEGSMAINYLANDENGNTGLDRPVLALKYADPAKGAGGFLGVALPVGFEDIMNSGNYASMIFGVMYGKEFPRVKVLANASYTFNTEDSDKSKVDNLRLFVKPEYPLPLKWFYEHKQYLGVNMALAYDYYFNTMVGGVSVDEGAHLAQVAPGLFYTINRIMSMEANAPFSVAGQNNAAFAALRVKLIFSLEETIYNAL